MKHSIYKISFELIFISFLSYLIKYLLNTFLAQHLSAEIYGDLSIAVQALTVSGIVMLLGNDTSAKRFLPSYFEKGDIHASASFIAWSMKTLFLTSLATIILAAIALGAAFILDKLQIYSLDNYHLAFKILWLSPLLALTLLFASILLSNKNYLSSTIFPNLGRNLLFLSGVLIAVNFLETSLTENRIIFIFMICFIILLILQVMTINMRTPFHFHQHVKLLLHPPKASEHWKKSSLQLCINNIVYAFLAAADLLMIEIIEPGEKTTGYYAACLIIAGIIWLIPQSTQQLIKPQISSLLEKKHYPVLQNLLASANRIQICILFLTSLIIIIFSKAMLRHFGNDYPCSQPALIILCIGFAIGGQLKTANSFLMFSGLESILAKITCLELFFIIMTGAPLIYYFGAVGAAISTSSTIILSGLTATFFAKKHFPNLHVLGLTSK